MSNKISILGNPFYLQGITWTIVVSIYGLGWSDLYPKLSVELSFYLLITIIIYISFGYYFQKKRKFIYKKNEINQKQQNNIVRSLQFLYILFFIEILFTLCPLWSYLTTGETDYTEFGLPYIHVIIVAGFSIICWFSFHGLISTENKLIKKKLFKYIVLGIIPFIIMFNRGGIMSILLGMGLMYLMSIKIRIKHCLYSLLVSLTVLWLFGLAGDMRTDLRPDQHLILDLGGATDNFKNSWIPPEFFWSYTYMISPLGNVQNNINQTKEIDYSLNSLSEMVLFDFMPVIISKRVAPMIEIEEKHPELVVPNLNVSTVYKNSYNYLGWFGISLMFLFSIFFVIVTIGLANFKSPLYITLLTSVNVIVIMNLFNNMFIYMGLAPISFVLLVLSRRYKKLSFTNLQ